jgi:transcription antitermination factor NusA-like protein
MEQRTTAAQRPRPDVGELVMFDPRLTEVLGDVVGTIDGYPARLPASQRIAGERVERMHAVVTVIAGDELIVSRRVPALVEALLHRLPLIESGDVEIVRVVREAGVRTKVAITTSVEELLGDPDLMARLCVEPILTRIVADSGDPLIDVVAMEDPLSAFACNALAVDVTHLAIDQDREELLLAMHDHEVAALDRVNLQLAADLVGWSMAVVRGSDHARVQWDAPIVERAKPRGSAPRVESELDQHSPLRYGSHMSDAMPVGIAGHGLLLSPHCPCRVAHLENGTLLVQPIAVDRSRALPPVAAVALGARSAHAEASRVDDHRMPTWRYGADGPTISLGNQAERLDEVLAQVDVVPGESPWHLLGPGFWIAFPPSFTLHSAPADRGLRFQLVQKGDEPNALIAFDSHPIRAEALRFGGDGLVDGALQIDGGSVRTATRTYEHAGKRWQARYYALPLADDETVVMSAQAPIAQSERMFAAADAMAESFAPMETT